MLYSKRSFQVRKSSGRRSNRRRKNTETCQKEKTFSRGAKIKEKVQKAKSAPLSRSDLISVLCFKPNFVGVFAANEIQSLKVKRFPSFLIVNTSDSNFSYGHWIALMITRTKIEIFDSLGGRPENWGNYPENILRFLIHYSFSHNFVISPQLQSIDSQLCGIYCIYYILFRRRKSFINLCRPFTYNFEQNDLIVSDLVLKY